MVIITTRPYGLIYTQLHNYHRNHESCNDDNRGIHPAVEFMLPCSSLPVRDKKHCFIHAKSTMACYGSHGYEQLQPQLQRTTLIVLDDTTRHHPFVIISIIIWFDDKDVER